MTERQKCNNNIVDKKMLLLQLSWAHKNANMISNNKLKWFTWSPARAERETAFALDFPESLPALPPA